MVVLEERPHRPETAGRRARRAALLVRIAELLYEVLGVRPGSVTPFAAVNDTAAASRSCSTAGDAGHDPLNYHPLENDRTTAIAPADLAALPRRLRPRPAHRRSRCPPNAAPVEWPRKPRRRLSSRAACRHVVRKSRGEAAMANEPMIGGGWAAARAPPPPVKDVTTANFMAEVVDASFEHAGHRRFLGAVVRPVQAAGPDPRKGGARGQRRGAHGQAQHRREPRDRAADAHPVDPGGLCLQGRPPGRRLCRRGAGKPGQAVRPAARRRRAAARRRSRRRWRWPRRRCRTAITPAPAASIARSCSASPDNVEALAGLARALIARGDYAKARQAARRGCRRSSPATPRSRRRTPRSSSPSRRRRRWARPASCAPGSSTNADDHEARFELATALFGAGEREEAHRRAADPVQARPRMERGGGAQAAGQVLRGDGADRPADRERRGGACRR